MKTVFEDRESALRASLERLAFVYGHCGDPFDDAKYPAHPRHDHQAMRDRITPLFPGLGFYNVVLQVNTRVGAPGLGTADAIDDLADIAIDLLDVLYRWEKTSEDDAIWHFRFGFESHRGHHLRTVQVCLHERLRPWSGAAAAASSLSGEEQESS